MLHFEVSDSNKFKDEFLKHVTWLYESHVKLVQDVECSDHHRSVNMIAEKVFQFIAHSYPNTVLPLPTYGTWSAEGGIASVVKIYLNYQKLLSSFLFTCGSLLSSWIP